MKLFFTISLAFFILGCKSSKEMSDQPINTNVQVTAVLGETKISSDQISITSIKIEGNKMLIDVSYSGGCENHEFQVIGSTMISKSLPPIRAFQLIHNANGDKCKKLVMQTLEVDIKALAYKQEAGSKIFLSLEGWKEKIEYTFE